MKVTKVEPKSKITFKTRAIDESQVLSQWWLESNSDKAASQMLMSAAYLKESQQYRYRQAAIYARLYGNQSLYSFAGSNISKIDSTGQLNQERPIVVGNSNAYKCMVWIGQTDRLID